MLADKNHTSISVGRAKHFAQKRNTIIDKLKNMLDLPISGEYGELTDHEKVEEYLNNQVSNIIDNLNPELMSFNEDKIINHLIELKDLSRKTGIYISDAMIKGILASYNKNYANPDAEEFKAFDTIFASEGIIDGPSLQYDVPEYSFLFKLVKINKVSSLLDNNKINTILNIMDNDSPNFSNVELSLRDIDEDIPGSSVLDKRSFLVDLLKRRAGITLANINKYSSSIDPEAPAFNYFSQENIVYLPFRYMSVISSDLAKRFKKHVDIMENIEALNFALLNKKLSRNERHELLETKDRLVLLKEEYLGLILQDEFIGINRIFETINDSGLDDIKQKALEIENLLKLFFDSKNNEAGDLDEIISRTINNFNQDKLLETVKNSTDINFIQNSKIEAILTSFNLIKEYFIACDNFDKDKDFNKNFKFLDDRSTIEKSNYKIQFTTIGYIKELYYDLQMFVIKTVSFIVYRAYDILINKIVMPLFNFIADVLNYPVLVGHYGTVQEAQEYLENRKRILLYDQGVLSSDSSSDSEQDEANDAQLDEDLSNQGVVSWYWSQACSLAANYTPEIVSSTISGASQKVFGSKKQTA